MTRRKQPQPRPCYLHTDPPNANDNGNDDYGELSDAGSDSNGSFTSEEEEGLILLELGQPEDDEDDDDDDDLIDNQLLPSTSEFRRRQVGKESDKMPPTDGQVVVSTPPNSGSSANHSGTGGDSNAASAANSALSVPFTCNFCQRSFPRLSLLKKHEQAHSDEMPFRCDFCLRLFKHKRSRDRHVKLHTGDKKYRCQHCEAAFSRSDHLKIHVKTHDTRKPFQCSVCQRGYSTAAALTSHMLNHRRESGSRCGSLCSSSSSVSSISVASTTCSSAMATPAHGRSLSSNASTPCPASLPSSSPVSPPPTPTNDAPVVQMMDQTTAIDNKQQPPPSSVTPPMEPPNSPSSPPISQYQNPSKTEVLDKSTVIRPALEPQTALLKSDTDGNKEGSDNGTQAAKVLPIALQCPYCAKESFTSLAALSLHVQTLHGPLSRGVGHNGVADPVQQHGLLYACQLCTLRFGNLPALQQHTLSAHSLADVLRLYCPAPPGKIGQPIEQPDSQNFPTDLSCPKKRNEVEEEGRYSCSQCPSEFKQSESEAFQAHMAGHFMSSWNEYGCSSCVKSFPTPDELQKHLLDMHAHHLYRCALCKETFDSKVSIQVHLAVQHSSESKLFRCTGCSADDEASSVFRTEEEFNTHVAAVHAPKILPVKQQQPVALLKCPLCPQSFPVEFLLERHMHLNHQDHKVPLAVTPTERPVPVPATKMEKTEKVDSSSSAASTVLNLSLHCAYCGETCKSRSELESHMKSAHHPPGSTTVSSSANLLPSPAGNGRIKCNICDEVFPSASVLAEHKLSHCKVSGAAVCAQCRVPLPTEEAYYAHLQAPPHGPSATPPLTCLVCRQTLNLPLEVGLHARFHTASRPAAVPAQPEPSLYPCSFCQRHLESANLIANGMALNGQQTYICKDCLHVHNQMMVHQQTALFPALPPQPVAAPRSYQCIKCQEIFASEAEIQSHVASHLVSEGCLHPCRLCARQFDTPLKLQAHLIEHTFAGCPAFACYLCGCLFTAAVNLQRHMFEQHGGASGLRPYDCSRCHLKFFFRAELDNHLLSHVEPPPLNESTERSPRPEGEPKTVHVSEESRSFNEEEEEEEEEEEMNDEDDNISVTSSSHASEITLSDAQKAANAVPEEISEERNSKDSEMSDSSDSSSMFSSTSSTSCSAVARKELLPESPSSATSPFRCDRCDQSFPCLSNLQGHVRIHTQSRRFTCPEASCGKEFALRRNLHIHMRSHTGDRPYSCPVCPKRFARKENRKAHLKLHSGVKPFSCPVCAKTFARKSHLVEHGRTHSSAGGDPLPINGSAMKTPVTASVETNATVAEESVDIN